MPINKICLVCKKPFSAYPSDIKMGRGKFCSWKCYSISRKGKFKGKDNPNWKGRVNRICQTCGKVFEVKPCEEKRKFCSQKCYAKDWNSRIPGWNRGEFFETICKNCGQTIPKGKGTYSCKRNFCSRKCANQFNVRRGENHPNWRNGASFEPYSPSFNQQLKDRIRVRDNFICQECGVPELECFRRLDVHHIDYNKKNCEMNNLISLCNKCNAKANYNREYWTKHYQKKIREKLDFVKLRDGKKKLK